MEAASYSRRVRLEELKRRKQSALQHPHGASHPRQHGTAMQEGGEDAESVGMIRFEDDAEMLAATEERELDSLFRTWSTAKLVRSFRMLDRKVRVDYDKLKDTVEKGV